MSGTRKRFAVLVAWNGGEEEYLKRGMGQNVATFPNRRRAEEQRDFMLEGMSDQVQSINVVLAPGNPARRLDG